MPKRIVDHLSDVGYFEVRHEGDRILLEPFRPDSAREVRNKLGELGVSESDVVRAAVRALGVLRIRRIGSSSPLLRAAARSCSVTGDAALLALDGRTAFDIVRPATLRKRVLS